MKPFFMLFVLSLMGSGLTKAQHELLLADLTMEIAANKEEMLYYGFEKGDQLVLSVELLEGKTLKELEVVEYPDNARFAAYEVKGRLEKRIEVSQRGIYQIRLHNASKKALVQFQIKRIPASEHTAGFNTKIIWKERIDTLYDIKSEEVISGSKTAYVNLRRRVARKIDTTVVTLLEQTERIHSSSRINASNKAHLQFDLPLNQYKPNAQEPDFSSELVAWAYYIGTGEEGEKWYNEANLKALGKTATSGAVGAGLISSGYGALALLAIEGISMFSNPPDGENVQFTLWFDESDAVQQVATGNSIVGYGRIDRIKQGHFRLELENDNLLEGINVHVKVIAIVVQTTYGDEYYTELRENPLNERKIVREPRLQKVRYPSLVEEKP